MNQRAVIFCRWRCLRNDRQLKALNSRMNQERLARRSSHVSEICGATRWGRAIDEQKSVSDTIRPNIFSK